ncbi:A/G-specific adenine glycosylase [Myroides sp. LJL115]
MIFSNKLTTWYLQNKRSLPWRETNNPYAIWLSEIILQQTKVAQGLPYYLSFLETFPTVFDLANAEEDQVLRLWQGLGYYSRARNLHASAKIIAYDLNGIFPNNYKDLLSLKGVGPYTAAAIASIAFNENVAVLDGNVYRVLSRIFGITTDISSGAAKKEFQNLAQSLLPKEQPAIFNQAIMDFGAMQCTPKLPLCQSCVFNTTCVALQTNMVSILPVKLKKTKVRNRYIDYIIFQDEQKNTLIEQRTKKDIWQKLYQFPCIDRFEDTPIDIKQVLKSDFPTVETCQITLMNTTPITHILSHQKLQVNFWIVQTKEPLKESTPWKELNNFGFPIVIHNFIGTLSEE